MKRLFIGIIILVLALWFHPFAGLIVATIYSFFNTGRYYELIVLGIILDVLYHSIISFGIFSLPLYTIVSIVVFAITSYMKKRMNLYA